MSDLIIVSSILIFLTVFSAISLLFVSQIQIVSIASLSWFSGSTIAVAGVCVVATGIPCAVALAVYTVATFLTTYFYSSNFSWIGTLIFTPISIILVIFIARLGRGVAGGG